MRSKILLIYRENCNISQKMVNFMEVFILRFTPGNCQTDNKNTTQTGRWFKYRGLSERRR